MPPTINKDRKNEKPLYDSSAISKFSNANLSLDKPVMIKNSIDIVYSKDIVFIEASYSEGRKSAVVMRDESVKPCSVVLNKIEDILDPNVFYRLNRSTLLIYTKFQKSNVDSVIFV